MKKLLSLLLAVALLALSSCTAPTEPSDSSSDTSSLPISESGVDESSAATASSSENGTEPITTVKALRKIEEVIDVRELTLPKSCAYAVAYRLLFSSDGLQIAADLVLPVDYAAHTYPVLLYIPDVKTTPESLADDYAKQGIITVRVYLRGKEESDGQRDMAGKDLADLQTLIKICDRTEFMGKSKLFVAGAVEGSMYALRLLAEDHAGRITGCAVVDAITDLHGYCEARGEAVTNLAKALIGKDYEQAPEEYELRSAVSFAEKLQDRPLLLFRWAQSPFDPPEQSEQLCTLLEGSTGFRFAQIDALSSDFHGEALEQLRAFLQAWK